ncbi:MAG: PAS domain-containing protein [Acidobacteriota bacterium]
MTLDASSAPSPATSAGLPELHQMDEIDGMSPSELDELPYGAIKLDADGSIVEYNLAEAKISGRDKERVIGRNFFTQVAPCTNVQEFAGRFREGVAKEELNHVFPYTFDFEMAPTEVWIRLYYSHESEAAWVFVARKEAN